MPNMRLQRKAELIAGVLDQIRRRLPSGEAAAIARFTERFYHNVALDDLERRSAEELAGAVLSMWRTGARRRPGTSRVEVFNPRLDEHGWQSPHTVIQTVNDDMPFIVDSIVSELNRRDLLVHLTIHPIVKVRRDSEGRLLGLVDAAEDETGDGVIQESFMHVEIEEQAESALPAIRRCIEDILGDVRLAVSDWRRIVAEIDDVIENLEKKPPPLDPTHVAEARAFLAWMRDDHFTFLGYRAYDLVTENGEQFVRLRENTGLGILRRLTEESRRRHTTPLRPTEREFANRREVLIIRKAYDRSTVHRPVHMDYVGVREFDSEGRVVGERRFLGLFTSSAYRERPSAIPMLREKIRRIIDRAGFSPQSHDGKALEHVLETYPRDELYQMDEDELFEAVLRLIRVEERPRVALFVRPDPFERFMSCLVVVPREHYSTAIRERFQRILESSFNGTVAAYATEIGDEPLARLHFAVSTEPDRIPPFDPDLIESKLAEAAKSWAEHLKEALVSRHGEEKGLALWRRYRTALPVAYTEAVAAEFAVLDIALIEEALRSGRLETSLYQTLDPGPNSLGLKMVHPGTPVILSDVIPLLEHAGLRVVSEIPYNVTLHDGATQVWLHDFLLRVDGDGEIDFHDVREKFHDLIARVWRGEVEDDGFNRLVLAAGLTWREVVWLRTCCKYLRQTGIPFSEAYMQETLARNAGIARLLVAFVEARFQVESGSHPYAREVEIGVRIEEALEQVANLDEDRILRRFYNFFRSTLRTNIFQTDAEGRPKPYVSFKIDSRAIEDLPLPRPLYEIFVYSPRVEAIHLRGGKVARGGIRWSDRREDFRTEILGLMKAQMVKNAVIVPVGSKGGFVVKRPPADGGREALTEEVVFCYKTFIQGLLDLTDNYKGDAVITPPRVRRHDDDDPYLVVAADKGTAAFSDIANGISRAYGFWLDDAFASGGSTGYDHKKMGITARGAWESVKRHFREMNRDIQNEDFTVVGVGDMSGDVFGNGMLLSRHIKLLAAFNHLHVFIDPDPDPVASFAERERLFRLPRSTWADYNRDLISKGGGVFERSAKYVPITPEMKARFGLKADRLTPAELIRALLAAEVDLLWFGGIGTFIKSSRESHADVGDRANDAVRVNANEVRAKVIGEGANLGCTQRGRVEYALAGGRINTDAIDNSGGVNCSDHEVNIKIALGHVVAAGDMTMKQRDMLLVDMTQEVAALVLRDNYLQPQALSVELARGMEAFDGHVTLIRALERRGLLNRAVEFLPDDEELADRAQQQKGLTRPELAVLLGYAKIALYDDLLPSDLPDDPLLEPDLVQYFPERMTARFADVLKRHRLRREIIATRATNSLINRAGPAFVTLMTDRTGLPVSEVVRAYAVTRDVFDLRDLWAAIEALDTRVPSEVQTRMLIEIVNLIHRCTLWFLLNLPHPLDTAAVTAEYGQGLRLLAERIGDLVAPADREHLAARVAELAAAGVPETLARAIASLDLRVAGCDVVRIATADGLDVAGVAKTYYTAGDRFGFDRLRRLARLAPAQSRWDKQALDAILDDLYGYQSQLTSRILEAAGGLGTAEALTDAWARTHEHVVKRIDGLLAELEMAPQVDVSMLAVVNRQLRALASA